MKPREVTAHVSRLGAEDWDRRLFDALIPLPDGTSYNAYLVKGSQKTVLVDSVDPPLVPILLAQLEGVQKIDYVVAHHAEQDHSGSIPIILERHPDAVVLASAKCKDLLVDHLHVSPERIQVVADGETVGLGDITLKFIYTPWVHWPETMCTWLEQDGVLFSCDFFGSHIASTGMYADDKGRAYEAAKRYFAEIMMPFRPTVMRNVEKVEALPIKVIAPSHGSMHREPKFIIDAYKDWLNDTPRNEVVVPYVSMHGSTKMMVERLVEELAERGVTVHQFDMTVTDIGKLAMSLVDAATIVIGTPTVHVAPHPAVFYAAFLANALRPKARFASIVGSYGWATKAPEKILELVPNLKVEVIPPVMCKGMPRAADLDAVENLAQIIAKKHEGAGLR